MAKKKASVGLNSLLTRIAEEKDMKPEQLVRLMNAIAYHETGGKSDPGIVQKGGGPGRGLFQFENSTDGGAIVAVRRLRNYLQDNDMPVPDWVDLLAKNDYVDASELDAEQQGMLFLGYHRYHPKANFANVKTDQDIEDFWAKYHWAGNAADEKARRKSFQGHFKDFVNQDKPFVYKAPQPTPEEFINQKVEIPIPDTFAPADATAVAPFPQKMFLGGIVNKGANMIGSAIGTPDAMKWANTIGSAAGTAVDIFTGNVPGAIANGADLVGDVAGQAGLAEKNPELMKMIGMGQGMAGLAGNFFEGGGVIPKRADDGHYRKNPDGTVSTHRMAWGESDNGYVAFPTVFPNPLIGVSTPSPAGWVEPDNAYQMAKDMGETYNFKSAAEAEAFADGNWKPENREKAQLKEDMIRMFPNFEMYRQHKYTPMMRRRMQGGGQIPGMVPMPGMAGAGMPQPQEELHEVEGGGTHEENPMGGVPIGPNASVEEEETMVDVPDGKYVYSARLEVTEEMAEKHGLPKRVIGKTFAEASEDLIDNERVNDPIAQRGNKEMEARLRNAQEEVRNGQIGQAQDFISTQTPEDMATLAPEDQAMFAMGGYYITDKDKFNKIAETLDMGMYDLAKKCGGKIKMQGGGLLPTGTGMMDISQFLDPNFLQDITKLPSINTPGLDAVSPTENGNVPLDIKLTPMDTAGLSRYATGAAEEEAAQVPLIEPKGWQPPSEVPEISGWNKAMRYAPVAANAFQIAKATEPIDRLEGRDYYIPESLDRPRYDVAPEIANLRGLSGAASRDLVSASGGSGGAAAANLTGNNVNLRRGMSEAYDRKQRTDINTDLSVQQQEQQAKQYNRGMDYQSDLANQAAQAAKDQLLTTGVNAAGENLGAIGKEGYQRDLIRRMFPYGPEGDYQMSELNKELRSQALQAYWLKRAGLTS